MNMRGKVFARLLKGRGGYVSGEALSGELGISRAAVGKHVRLIAADGADIVSVPNKGHMLKGLPDRLKPEYVLPMMPAPADFNYFWAEEVDSTNDVLKREAAKNPLQTAVAAAEGQTGGKGRKGRDWVSVCGKGLFFSILATPDMPPNKTAGITLIPAIAVCRAILEQTGIRTGIKWPNDIIAGGKKVCGISAGLSANMDAVGLDATENVIIGIGVNVNEAEGDIPGALRQKAVSLKMLLKKTVSRPALMARILHEFFELYDVYVRHGVGRFMDEYTKLSVLPGKNVRVLGGPAMLSGKCAGFDETGALLLQDKTGKTVRIIGGELSVRGEDGYV